MSLNQHPQVASCPSCGAVLTDGAEICVCGFNLKSEGGSDHLIVKAERLYETYLRARVQRARVLVNELKRRKHRGSWGPADTKRLVVAEKELRALEIQLATQSMKAERAPRAPEQIQENTPPPAVSDEPITERMDPPQGSDVGAETVDSAAEAVAFREAQAQRAQAIPAAAAGRPFTDGQARRGDEALAQMRDATAPKVCPECHATLSPSASHCVCGYSFNLPRTRSPFLKAGELSALAPAPSPSKNRP